MKEVIVEKWAMNSKTEPTDLNQVSFTLCSQPADLQLQISTSEIWWRAREESNLRHPAPEAGALSTELLAHKILLLGVWVGVL